MRALVPDPEIALRHGVDLRSIEEEVGDRGGIRKTPGVEFRAVDTDAGRSRSRYRA